MNDQKQTTIYVTVKYRGRLLGNVAVTITGDNVGYAPIDGRSRTITYRIATRGNDKGQMRWHCDD